MVLELDSANYDEILSSTEFVLLDFWAPWCGPCKVMKPIFEKLAEQFSDQEGLTFATVNVDESSDLAQHYQIMSIPTFIMFKNKNIHGVMSGTNSFEDMERFIAKNFK